MRETYHAERGPPVAARCGEPAKQPHEYTLGDVASQIAEEAKLAAEIARMAAAVDNKLAEFIGNPKLTANCSGPECSAPHVGHHLSELHQAHIRTLEQLNSVLRRL